MKLLLITPNVVRNDGQGRVNYEIARAALQTGAEVTILTSVCAPEISNQPNAEVVIMSKLGAPTELLRGLIFAFRCGLWLKSRRNRFDVVHIHEYVFGADADVHTIHFVHSAWRVNRWYPFRKFWQTPYAAYQFLYTSLHSFLEQRAFRRDKWVVPVSNAVAGELRALHVPGEKLKVVFNGVDVDEFFPSAGDRAVFGLAADVYLLLFSGDIRTSRKNLGTVLAALRRVPNVHLAVAGKLEGSPFPEMARALGLGDRVHFLGFVRNMPELMRAVHVFVFPSRYEACSLVLLEAMASGLPIVTAKSAGGAELIQEGGIVIDDPDNDIALAGAIEALRDEETRLKMSAEGRRIALRHSWSTMAEEYLSLYRAIGEEPRR